MEIKYYSEVLDKYFDSKNECAKAEKEKEEALAEEKKKKDAKEKAFNEVEAAYAEVAEARKRADKKLEEFIKEYGSYCSTKVESPLVKTFSDLLGFGFFGL